MNAGRSLQTFVREADNRLLYDNEAWREPGESDGVAYATMNEALVRRLGVLFGAGELSSGDIEARVVDSSGIINTLTGGGVSCIGYANGELGNAANGSLLSRFDVDDEPVKDTAISTSRITGLVRKATLGRLSLLCEVSGAGRALLVVAGPAGFLNRMGVERAQNWLGEETGSMEVRGGDYPLPGEDKVASVVLLSRLTSVPRIDELKSQAAEASESMRGGSWGDVNSVDGLLDEGLDPPF